MSDGIPALALRRSQLVEAICILLCQKNADAQNTPQWRKILTDNNSIQGQIFNSEALLEGDNVTLYAINQTTLVSWHFVQHHRIIISYFIARLNGSRTKLGERRSFHQCRA